MEDDLEEQIVKGVEEFQKVKTIEQVWEIEDQNNFVAHMSLYIDEKCEYGDKIGKLNKKEKVIFMTKNLEDEVYNGGFLQFFYNSSGMFSNQLVKAFQEIGATYTADICQKAVRALKRRLPKNEERREKLLDKIVDKDIENILSECDDMFYEEKEDLVQLNYEYIMKNKSYFIK